MTDARHETGLIGERIAERWLRRNGWEILDRRFRSGHRDIDLIAARAESGSRLVSFVEVRTRYSARFGTPAATVGWRKQRELARSARAWVASNKRSGDVYRFDVVGVLVEGGRAQIEHVPDAFWLRGFG